VAVGIRYGLEGFRQGLKEGYHSLRAPTIFDKGCVLFLPLNSAPNRITPDLSGCGNHGILYGPVLKDIGEEYYLKFKNRLVTVGGKGFYFDGADDGIKLNYDASLDIFTSDSWAIEMWFKPDEQVMTGDLVNAVWHKPRLYVNTSQELVLAAFIGGTYTVLISGSSATYVGTKTTYLVMQANPQSGNYEMWINGVLKVSVAYQQMDGGWSILTIGNANNSQEFYKGFIYLVRFYSRFLSEREIKLHYMIEKDMFRV